MEKSEFIRSVIPGITIATLYLTEGSGMGNEHLELANIYVASNRKQVEEMVIADYGIKNQTVQQWLNSAHGELNYHDEVIN